MIAGGIELIVAVEVEVEHLTSPLVLTVPMLLPVLPQHPQQLQRVLVVVGEALTLVEQLRQEVQVVQVDRDIS